MLMRLRSAPSILSLLLMAGCGGGGTSAPSTVTIGGTVTGLVGKVVLQNNAGDNLTVGTNGVFTFATPLNKGSAYAVSILTQPPGPSCVVWNGAGAATADVTSVSVTCTTDPTTVFLPIAATTVPESTVPGATGLFVISSKSPADPPIRVTTENVSSLGLQSQYAISGPGAASAGNPYALMYTTLNSASGDHVWSLSLSGTSSLVPTQLSNLTIPYHTATLHGQVAPVQYCASLVIPKSLVDPSSAFLILALPTDTTSLCGGSATGFKWLLVHSSDGPKTDPVNLPALSGPILPLYRPDGALAGLVTIDGSHNLNLYPDETFTHPIQLLANVASFSPRQEAPGSSISRISAKPTYSFLLVQPLNAISGPAAVYRVDYSGSISTDLYDFQGSYINGLAVDSGNLYFTDTTGTAGAYQESVGRIPNGGGPAQILYTSAPSNSALPVLTGVSGSDLVFWRITGFNASTSQQLSDVETLPTVAPGTLTTIASYDRLAGVALAGGDVFVTLSYVSSSPVPGIEYSTQILDITGHVLQASVPSSSFVSNGAPVLQVRNITDAGYLGGGEVYALDLGQPASPTPVALKLVTGAAFTLPSGTNNVSLQPVTTAIGVANDISVQSGGTGLALVYDLAKGVIVPITMPNTYFRFVTLTATLAH